jgi:integrase
MRTVPQGQQRRKAWECGMTVKAVWHIAKESAQSIGGTKLAPHDLRRTCARLCYASGGGGCRRYGSWRARLEFVPQRELHNARLGQQTGVGAEVVR